MGLLEQIEAHLERTRVAPSTFGRLAAGDPRLVADLRAGRQLREATRSRIMHYLRENRRRNP